MNPFVPEFEGELRLPRIPDDFVARIRSRVDQGLLQPGMRARANYAVRSSGRDDITFGAEDFLTAYNVGLNDVHVRRTAPGAVRYRVAYWRWTRMAAAHGGFLGLVAVILFATLPQMRRDIASHPGGAMIFWGIVVFFSVLWPWILTAFHKRFAEQALQRILREVLS